MQAFTEPDDYKPVYYVSEYVYHEMLRVSRESAGREAGGILGGSNHTICKLHADPGLNAGKACSYTPDTHMLNRVISQWHAEHISFYGIFHSHFGNSDALSSGDIRYIEHIMKSMPETISSLLFPIVSLPQGRIFAYAAVIHRNISTAVQVEILPCEFMIQA